MNIAVVLGLLFSVAMVLAKKPLKELLGNEAAAKLEADEIIGQAAYEKKVEAKMADEGEADEEDEADSEEVNSAERNQADAYNRMMANRCCKYVCRTYSNGKRKCGNKCSSRYCK